MMRHTAILLCVVMLISQTPMQQVLKLPLLWEHFKAHQNLNSKLTFNQFLYSHYVTDDGNPLDNDIDQQLPFQNHKSLFTSFHCDWQPFVEVIFPQPFIGLDSYPNYLFSLTDITILPVFQPPKFV